MVVQNESKTKHKKEIETSSHRFAQAALVAAGLLLFWCIGPTTDVGLFGAVWAVDLLVQ